MPELTQINCAIKEKPTTEVLLRMNKKEIVRPFFKTLFVTPHAQTNFRDRITHFFPELTDFYHTIREHILTGEELASGNYEFKYLREHCQIFPDRSFRAWRKEITQEKNKMVFTFFYPCTYKPQTNTLFVLSVMPEEYLH